MDEQPVQLIKEPRRPIAATTRHARRVPRGVSRGTCPIAGAADSCHTPKHGSWLNIAENVLSSLTRQCVSDRRIGALPKLRSELRAWSNDANTMQCGVDGQMNTTDARCKLKLFYLKIRV
jgi:hypothetical protein